MNQRKAVKKLILRTGKWAIVLLLLSVLFVQQSVFAAAGEIDGTVFRDYNADGAKDTYEPGIKGAIVTIYDANGVSATTTTGDGGAYTIAKGGLTGNNVRVEFTLPSSLGFLEPGAAGGTTVQFADIDTGATLNVGFNNPVQYSQSDPELFAPVYIVQDNLSGPNNTDPVSGAVAYSANGTSPTINRQVPANEMGATYGVAWQIESSMLLTSSYVKNAAGLGPDGSGGTTTGGIYLVSGTGATATATLFMDLEGTLGLGSDPHPASTDTCTSAVRAGTDNTNCWYHDSGTFSVIGKMGLGDLDFNGDQTLLYTVDLTNRRLVEIPVGIPAVAPDPSSFQYYNIPTDACVNAADARPFALAPNDDNPDVMYVGVTCTGQSTGQASDMSLEVYEFDRTGSGTFTNIFSNTLNYPRLRSIGSWGNCSHGGGRCLATWRPWEDNIGSMNIVNETPPNGKQIAAHPQPMLSDIAFDGPDLVLAIRDRVSDMFGSALGNPVDNTDTLIYDSWAAGDLLRACDNGSGGWTMESNGVCGSVNGSGQNNTDGYSNGEYYLDQASGGEHSELFLGGMAQIPGFLNVAVTAYDASGAYNTGDIATWTNATGAQATGARLYLNVAPNFGKANGLGDLEPLRDPAPIEIGNRVWEDADGDGIQDPGEAILSGVSVALWVDTDGDGTVDVEAATTATDGNGRYLFSKHGTNSLGQTETWVDTSAVVDRYTAYEVRIALSDVGGRNLTARSSDGQIDNNSKEDLRDSDATLVNGTTAVIPFTTGGAGNNNHSLDFGFTPLSAAFDYGDLPNSFDTNTPNGPVHTITSNLLLGNCVDAETNGQPSDRAGVDGIEGDDNSISGAVTGVCSDVSDEDGVELLTPLVPGGQACVAVTAVNTLSNASLYGWIDFNGNGTFDTSEALDGGTIGTDGNFNSGAASVNSSITDGNYCFNVPTNAVFTGGETHMRFRLTTNSLTTSEWGGSAANGEVEDYYKMLSCIGNYVWHDSNGNGVQDGSESGINGVDVTLVWYGLDNIAGTSDDKTYTDTTISENGVDGKYNFCGLIPQDGSGNGGNYHTEISIAGQSALDGLDLTVANNGTGNDLDDSDGIQAGDPRTLAVASTINVVTANSLLENENSIGDDIHPNDFPDNQDNLASDFGFASYDWGDLPESADPLDYDMTTGSSNNGARHTLLPGLYLGNCVDAEANGQPNNMANNGDAIAAAASYLTDGSCSAVGDEDGVTIPSSADPRWENATASLPVVVSGDGCLNIWIDYGNGGIGDSLPDGEFRPDEHVLINAEVTAATTSVLVDVPAWAFDASYSGNRSPFMRARLTPRDADNGCSNAEGYVAGSASVDGLAIGGEVEDYRMSFSPTAVSLSSFSANNNAANSVALVIVFSLILAAGSFIIIRRRKATE